MYTYDELRGAFFKLRKREGLKLIETNLTNDKILAVRKKDIVILNKSYYKFKKGKRA